MTPQDLLASLDRCEHGRHASDNCWGCPDGQSTGNLLLAPGTVIGHTYGGDKIVVPQTGLHDTDNWIKRY